MPSLAVCKTLLREVATWERVIRIPEPDLVMDDPAKVAAYVEAGRPGGVMAPVYLFHCANACEVIRPGERVLDLACGPANQLAMIAKLNPDVRFVGMDLSEPMLSRAREYVAASGLRNVEFELCDITNLRQIAEGSVDAVISTMALHHLPTARHLAATFAEVKRILKPGGGVYIVDFGHLKSARSIHYFAYQYADRQPELFTLDYLYSLRAAFPAADFEAAAAQMRSVARLYRTFLSPYMVALKSPPRRDADLGLEQSIRNLRVALPPHHKGDLRDLITFFALGGLRCRLLS